MGRGRITSAASRAEGASEGGPAPSGRSGVQPMDDGGGYSAAGDAVRTRGSARATAAAAAAAGAAAGTAAGTAAKVGAPLRAAARSTSASAAAAAECARHWPGLPAARP